MQAETRQHINQAIRAEEIDPASQEVAHARLCNFQDRGGLRLRQCAHGDRLLKLDQQVSADQQVLGFVGGEPEIAEEIAGRRRNLQTLFSWHCRLAS